MTRIKPNPTITDQEVALLPLADGRVDLLEEIMSTPVLDHAEPTTRRTAPGWLVIGAAAAAVAAVALGSTLGGGQPAAPAEQRILQPAAPGVPDGRYVGLEVPGWEIESLYEGAGSLTLGWTNGDQWLEVNRMPADGYTSYFDDRNHDMDGRATTLLGHDATTWAYSSDDHATMTEPADGFYFEVRAAGMRLAEYEELIAGLVQTDEAGFYDGLPEGTVTPENRDQAIRNLLRGVTVPDGFGVDDVRIDGFASPYHAASRVVGAVGCAWLEVYDGGSVAQQEQALAAFDGSRDWPLLQSIDTEGDYPEAFWMLDDDLRGGRPAGELRSTIC